MNKIAALLVPAFLLVSVACDAAVEKDAELEKNYSLSVEAPALEETAYNLLIMEDVNEGPSIEKKPLAVKRQCVANRNMVNCLH